MERKVQSNHFKQPTADNSALYAVANAIIDESVLSRTDVINPGGNNFEDISSLLSLYEFKLKLLYYSVSPTVTIGSSDIYFSPESLKIYKKDDFLPLLLCVTENGLNHVITVFHFPFDKKFVIIDSLKDHATIVDSFDDIISKYKIFELYHISTFNNETGFKTNVECYLSEIVKILRKKR